MATLDEVCQRFTPLVQKLLPVYDNKHEFKFVIEKLAPFVDGIIETAELDLDADENLSYEVLKDVLSQSDAKFTASETDQLLHLVYMKSKSC